MSAYHHLEARFGRWARTYAVACYLLTQFARVGSILFGVALAMNALTGWPVPWIILTTGVVVTAYTLIGGIEAVIWTDVIQSVVLTVGALFVVGLLIVDTPGGLGALVETAQSAEKFSLGSYAFDFTTSTFWVVLIYGLFINFTNFGIDQSYVQRYHAANSDRAASRSVWLAAGLYLPVSAVFFFIGTGLFVVLEGQPEAAGLAADQAFPHYISTRLPAGAAGLLIAALFAAAMSSIDTSLNSSATVLLSDVYRTYLRPEPGPAGAETEDLQVLRRATVCVGVLGTGAALLMIGVASLLDAWWTWSGVFAGGLLGLFALDRLAPRAGRAAAQLGVAVGVLVIVWMTASPRLEGGLADAAEPAPQLHDHRRRHAGDLRGWVAGLAVAADEQRCDRVKFSDVRTRRSAFAACRPPTPPRDDAGSFAARSPARGLREPGRPAGRRTGRLHGRRMGGHRCAGRGVAFPSRARRRRSGSHRVHHRVARARRRASG